MGSVAAVDRSEHAISIAQYRHDGSPVTYTIGDVTALDFPEGNFDGVRCERVLQHLSDPDGAIKELTRVTRPGGRVCVIDTDWTSCVWDGFDHLDEVVGQLPGENWDSGAGRTTRAQMMRAGLREITALPVTLRFTSPTDAAVVVPFFARGGMMQQILPAELHDRFFASVDRSADRGDFLFAFTMWICQGRVPVG
jgi:ubiquinone/menaquinone biosynthesis C-methylase UbiE